MLDELSFDKIFCQLQSVADCSTKSGCSILFSTSAVKSQAAVMPKTDSSNRPKSSTLLKSKKRRRSLSLKKPAEPHT